MGHSIHPFALYFLMAALWLFVSCTNSNTNPATGVRNNLSLKRGDIIACGPPNKEFGTINFINSCSPKNKKDFDLAVALLHSFEYDEAEKAFANVIDADPNCAMAYWSVAMSNYHQVWPTTPSREELEKGSKAISIAQSLPQKSEIEIAYINAMATFYKDYQTVEHRTRAQAFFESYGRLARSIPNR